ncbi:hypothetical protein IWW45_006580, partial [Coemansia sp. RSA 485]
QTGVSEAGALVPVSGPGLDANGSSHAALVAAGGLNISLLNASLAMDAAQIQQQQQQLQLQQQVLALTATPMSTAHNTPLATPLLSPSVPVEKTDVVMTAASHFPSLPSVPEEMTICTEPFGAMPVNGSSGSSSSTVLSTLPTLVEAADEDVNMG